MNKERNTTFINLDNVITISRGNTDRMIKYLNQFQELIPERLQQLKKALDNNDRKQIRQVLHKMSPQLQFFGIQDIIKPIQRLEFEYNTMSFLELEALGNDIIYKLEGATKEVSQIIESHFE